MGNIPTFQYSRKAIKGERVGMNQDDQREWIAVSVVGRDRPGIIANVSGVLYQNRCSIEELSQTAIRGQFAMILTASVGEGVSVRNLKSDFAELAKDLDLDINLRQLKPEDMVPFQAGETEPFIIIVRGEDRPGLVYGIAEVLAERGINITNLAARVALVSQSPSICRFSRWIFPKNWTMAWCKKNFDTEGKRWESLWTCSIGTFSGRSIKYEKEVASCGLRNVGACGARP